MVEITKLGNKTLLVDGKMLYLYKRSELLRQMYYGGYEDFDNANGGTWKKYINIPITTIPLEYAQYFIEIDSTNVSVYNVEGTLKAQAPIASGFWSLVRTDGFDIRTFDHLFNQLYFWIEEFNYANQIAKIWVRVPENTEELNIAFGNEKASDSVYNDGDKTFEFFDDFLGTFLDPNKWTWSVGIGSLTVQDSWLRMYYVGGASGSTYANSIPKVDLAEKLIFRWYGYFYHIPSCKAINHILRVDDNNREYFNHHDTGLGGTFRHQCIVTKAGTNYAARVDGVSEPIEGIFLLKHGILFTEAIMPTGHVLTVNQGLESGLAHISLSIGSWCSYGNNTVDARWDFVQILKYTDPASFGTPRITSF